MPERWQWSPKVVLFDEVTSALDPELVDEVLTVIRQLAADGMTIMLVSHEMEISRDVADTEVFMDGGLIVEKGPPRELFHAPESKRLNWFLNRFSSVRPFKP